MEQTRKQLSFLVQQNLHLQKVKVTREGVGGGRYSKSLSLQRKIPHSNKKFREKKIWRPPAMAMISKSNKSYSSERKAKVIFGQSAKERSTYYAWPGKNLEAKGNSLKIEV